MNSYGIDPHDGPLDPFNPRTHAGEAIADTRAWPGYGLIGIAIIALGMTLSAAGYGFAGWAVIGGAVCAASLALGTALVVMEHRRVQRLDDSGVPDPYAARTISCPPVARINPTPR